MKNLLLFLLAINISCSEHNNVKGTDFFQLIGSVKLMEETNYKVVRDNFDRWLRDPQDTLDFFHLTRFNEAGNPIDERSYHPQTRKYKLVYSYSYVEGRLDKILSYNIDEKILKTDKVVDLNGSFQIKELVTIPSGTATNDRTLFRWNGSHLSQVMAKGITTTNDFNQAGLIIKQTVSKKNEADQTTTFEYLSFDVQGNWTKQLIHYTNANSWFITERQISYY